MNYMLLAVKSIERVLNMGGGYLLNFFFTRHQMNQIHFMLIQPLYFNITICGKIV